MKTKIQFLITALVAITISMALSHAQTANKNYITTYVPQVAETNELAVPLQSKENCQKVIQYFDGLGRPVQGIQVAGTSLGKDLVQPISYDEFGREKRKYLPYVSSATDGSQSDGSYKSDAETNQASFYQTLGFGATELPFAETVFENSPLNRVLQQGAPGADWQPSAGHAIGLTYQANIAGEVKMYKVKDDGTLEESGSYNANELYATQTEDENKHLLKEYKDKQGQVVLKSVNDGTSWLNTYYVYDNYGLLRFVLPPKAVQRLAGIPEGIGEAEVIITNKTVNDYVGKSYLYKSNVTLTLGDGFKFAASDGSAFIVSQAGTVSKTDVMNQLAYQYTYDSRDRMIIKRLPGAEPVYMVYDKRDRLALSQDGVERESNQWNFIKYDELNRPVLTGIYTHTEEATQVQMQQVLDDMYNESSPRSYFVSRDNTGVLGYTNNSFPIKTVSNFHEYSTSSLSYSANALAPTPGTVTGDGLKVEYLTATYYDTYGFAGAHEFDNSNNISGYSDGEGDSRYFERLNGMVTGTKTKVLGSEAPQVLGFENWLSTTNYYDDRYRVIQSRRDLFYADSNMGKETASSLYNFVGKVKQTKQSQTFGSATTTVEKWFTYDHAGRLLKSEQQINGAGKTTISDMTYNEIGQLQKKTLGGIQAVDYKYNIRGWLTQINDPDNLGSDKFGMKLLYNDQDNNMNNSKQFNGNISAMIWNSSQKSEQGYAFSYDGINRLKGSDYKKVTSEIWSESKAFEEKAIDYDANGNINKLIRTGEGETKNELANYTYHYNGNQLTDLNGGTQYSYDKNGNATRDGFRGFDILYNQLNLPAIISKGSDNLSYIYSASGEKLAKQINGITQQYYAGQMVYNNSKQLDYLLHEEGMVKKVGSSFIYEYYLKDHLGSTRVVFNSGGVVEQNTEYYPFGLAFQNNNLGVNKYLYNGKELQDETIGGTFFGMYDYGARFYDPMIGRWHSVDPLAEKNRRWSPYTYCYDDPMKFIDPDGRNAIFSIDKNGNIVITADVYVSGANADKLEEIQKNINSTWKTTTYRKDGKTHSISFNIKVSSQNDWNKMSKEDKNAAKAKSNFVTMFNADESKRSYVVNGVNGNWNSNAKNSVYAHEMGHFLGFADRYTKANCIVGWGDTESKYVNNGGTDNNDVMGKAGNAVGVVGRFSPKAANALDNYANEHKGDATITGSSLNAPNREEKAFGLPSGCQVTADQDF